MTSIVFLFGTLIICYVIYLYYYQNCKKVNSQTICINNDSDKKKFEYLELIQLNFDKLKKYLIKTHPTHDITKNIKKNLLDTTIITEIISSKHVAYSKNKGEQISFCLEDDIIDNNTIMFVALHELSHIVTDEIGHTYIFWENFKFILKCAIKCNIYQPKNYKDYPVHFCNLKIDYNPLYG
mgnify:CR=1 FL=1